MEPSTIASPDLVTAVHALPVPGWACDGHGRLLVTNERWDAYVGEFARMRTHWLSDRLVHPHDVASLRMSWRRARRQGVEGEARARLRRFDGTWRWHAVRLVPAVDPRTSDGPVVAWMGCWIDVDDELHDLADLRRRVQLLEAQGEASLDATILVSPDRRLVWANQRAYDLWGTTRERFPPGSDLAVASAALANRVRDPERQEAALDGIYADRHRVIRDEVEMADGRTMQRYSTPVFGSDGELVGRMNSYRDVTVSRQEIADLHDRAKAAFVLDHVADAVVLVDDDGVVHIWNLAAELLTSVRAEDAVGRRISSVLPGWEGASLAIPVRDDVDRHRPPALVPVETPVGREAWVSAVGVRFDGGIVYALHDVTDDRRLERMRSDIVATVSHELRTPLTSIYGMAITLLDADARLDEGTRRRLLATVVEQAARLGYILDDILVANSLEAGSLTLRPSTIDPRDLVSRVLEAVATSLDPVLSIEATVDRGVPALSVDEARARQALQNLIENAVKYSPGGGTVHVHVRRSGDSAVAIEVTDQGLGIPPEELDDVFEKFHRLDPGMSLGVAGTGLGLYIARELARRMGGDLTLHSAAGVGSTFTLTLPAA